MCKAIKIICGVAFILVYATTAEGALTQTTVPPAKKVIRVEKDPLLKLIDNFLEMLRQGKVEQAYSELTTKEFQKDTPLEKFKLLVASEPVLSKNKLFQHRSFYVEDEIVSFEGDLISTDGAAIATEIDFVQEDNTWKIMGLQLYQPEPSTIPEKKWQSHANHLWPLQKSKNC